MECNLYIFCDCLSWCVWSSRLLYRYLYFHNFLMQFNGQIQISFPNPIETMRPQMISKMSTSANRMKLWHFFPAISMHTKQLPVTEWVDLFIRKFLFLVRIPYISQWTPGNSTYAYVYSWLNRIVLPSKWGKKAYQ